MNFGDLVATIRLNVDDIHGDLLTRDIAKNILGRAFTHIFRKLVNAELLTDFNTLTATFIINTREVLIGDALGHPVSATVLPAIQKVIAVHHSNTGDNIPILTRINALNSAVPSVYIRRVIEDNGNQHNIYLGYYTVPTTGFDVIVEYIEIQTDLNSITPNDSYDNFILGPEYHDVVVLYATILFLAKDEDRVATWAELYRDVLADILEFNEGSNEVADVYDGVWD